MTRYNWQHSDWPSFTYSLADLEEPLLQFTQRVGVASGVLQSLTADAHHETVIQLMLQEALKTSEIEGEYFSREDVLSSIQHNVGFGNQIVAKGNRNAIGVGQLMTMVRSTYQQPLSHAMLWEWHAVLLPEVRGITVGAYRSDALPMQIISGPVGKYRIHFEAPPSDRIPADMDQFIGWFNTAAQSGALGTKFAPVHAAIAHLYFESIHPFEDGNGRVGRAVAEKALSQGVGRPIFMSLSDAIQANKKAYYAQLERAQRTLDITEWITWFVTIVLESQKRAERQIDFTLRKTQFFDRYDKVLNERQRKVLRRMLQDGPDGFEGGMNASKYRGLTKVSKATATRDMQKLLDIGAFVHGESGGRSTTYHVNIQAHTPPRQV